MTRFFKGSEYYVYVCVCACVNINLSCLLRTSGYVTRYVFLVLPIIRTKFKKCLYHSKLYSESFVKHYYLKWWWCSSSTWIILIVLKCLVPWLFSSVHDTDLWMGPDVFGSIVIVCSLPWLLDHKKGNLFTQFTIISTWVILTLGLLYKFKSLVCYFLPNILTRMDLRRWSPRI